MGLCGGKGLCGFVWDENVDLDGNKYKIVRAAQRLSLRRVESLGHGLRHAALALGVGMERCSWRIH